MSEPSRPTVVLLDADGVIQRPTPLRESLWRQLVGGTNSVEAFLRDLFAIERPCYHGGDNFVTALPELLRRWNSTGTIEDVLHAWTSIEVDQKIIEMIATLRASGVPCCLATNQEPFRGRYMSNTLGYVEFFDRQFYSCEMGLSKPDPAYFRAILQTLTVAAAKSVGIRAELFPPESDTEPKVAMRRILVSHDLLPI